MSASPCPACGCAAVSPVHAVVARLRADDLDAAIDAGLLASTACPGCTDSCSRAFVEAAAQRRFALAARERFRARALRLERRAVRKAAARVAATPAQSQKPAIPAGAAAVLERALARAKGHAP